MAEKPTAYISKIVLFGGQEFSFQQNEKIILVGPNNSGKSQILHDIVIISAYGFDTRKIILNDIEIEKCGDKKDLLNFLNENADLIGEVFNYKGWSISSRLIHKWDDNYLQGGMIGGFLKNITANERLNICIEQSSIRPDEQKTKPQHILYDDNKKIEEISKYFREAFNKELMIDYKGGSSIPIHVGDLPDKAFINQVGDPYVKSVRANPRLKDQGDGMKSYAGILFETLVSNLDINLLDEPEAFLHPPQMRRLGQTLASKVTGQLIVATHSSDIMRGFLEGTNGQVRILRIRREGDSNFIHEAALSEIGELWKTPKLKYSNALESIFHEETIICEDDSDCRLFNAIADHLDKNNGTTKDIAYVPTGGKHGIKQIANILRQIGVPVKAVFDMDVLSEKKVLRETVSAFGGDWNDIEPLWQSIDQAVNNDENRLSADEIKTELIEYIEKNEGDNLSLSKIKTIIQQKSPWDSIKRFGECRIPTDEAQSQYEDLKNNLEKIGIYLVPVGQVESFYPEIEFHGPKFVNKLLSNVSLEDEKLQRLRAFVSHICAGKCAPLPKSAAN